MKLAYVLSVCDMTSLVKYLLRGTQRQFSENICSEDDLRSRIIGATRTICKVSHYWRWEQKNEEYNNAASSQVS